MYLMKFRSRKDRRFDMDWFDDDPSRSMTRTNCGTCGCALGHGPYAGIPKRSGETWHQYAHRAFVLLDEHGTWDCWNWCFSPLWSGNDNTAKGAAKRILWMLKHGIPHNYRDQIEGNAKLCYEK